MSNFAFATPSTSYLAFYLLLESKTLKTLRENIERSLLPRVVLILREMLIEKQEHYYEMRDISSVVSEDRNCEAR